MKTGREEAQVSKGSPRTLAKFATRLGLRSAGMLPTEGSSPLITLTTQKISALLAAGDAVLYTHDLIEWH